MTVNLLEMLRAGCALALLVCAGSCVGLAWESAKDGELGLAAGSVAFAMVLAASAGLIWIAVGEGIASVQR